MAETYKLITNDTSIFANSDGTLKSTKKYYVANVDVNDHSKLQQNPYISTVYETQYVNIKSLQFTYNNNSIAYLDISVKPNTGSTVRTTNISLKNADDRTSKNKLIIVQDNQSIPSPVITYGGLDVTITYNDNPYENTDTSYHTPTITVKQKKTTDGVDEWITLTSTEYTLHVSTTSTSITVDNSGKFKFNTTNTSTSQKDADIKFKITSTYGGSTEKTCTVVQLGTAESIITTEYSNLKITNATYPIIDCEGESVNISSLAYQYDKITYVNGVESSKSDGLTTGATITYSIKTNNNKNTTFSINSTTGKLTVSRLNDNTLITQQLIGVVTVTATITGTTNTITATKDVSIYQSGHTSAITYSDLNIISFKYNPATFGSNITSEMTSSPVISYTYKKQAGISCTDTFTNVGSATTESTGATITYSDSMSKGTINKNTGIFTIKNLNNNTESAVTIANITATVVIGSLSKTSTATIQQSGITAANTSYEWLKPSITLTYNTDAVTVTGGKAIFQISGKQQYYKWINGVKQPTLYTDTFTSLDDCTVTWTAVSSNTIATLSTTGADAGNITFKSNALNPNNRTYSVKLVVTRNSIKSDDISGSAIQPKDSIISTTYPEGGDALNITDISIVYSTAESPSNSLSTLTNFSFKQKVQPKYTWQSGSTSIETDTTKYKEFTISRRQDTCVFDVEIPNTYTSYISKNSNYSITWLEENLTGTAKTYNVTVKFTSNYGNKSVTQSVPVSQKSGTATYSDIKIIGFYYDPDTFNENAQSTDKPNVTVSQTYSVTHSDGTTTNNVYTESQLTLTYSCNTNNIVNASTGVVTLSAYKTGTARSYTITLTVTGKGSKTATATTKVTQQGYLNTTTTINSIGLSYNKAGSYGESINPNLTYNITFTTTYASGDISTTNITNSSMGSMKLNCTYAIDNTINSSNLIDTSVTATPTITSTGILQWSENVGYVGRNKIDPYVTVNCNITITGIVNSKTVTVRDSLSCKAEQNTATMYFDKTLGVYYNYSLYSTCPSTNISTDPTKPKYVPFAYEYGGIFRPRIDAIQAYHLIHTNNIDGTQDGNIHRWVGNIYIYNDKWPDTSNASAVFSCDSIEVDSKTGVAIVPDLTDTLTFERKTYTINVTVQGKPYGRPGQELPCSVTDYALIYQDIVKNIKWGTITELSTVYPVAPAKSTQQNAFAPIGWVMYPNSKAKQNAVVVYSSGKEISKEFDHTAPIIPGAPSAGMSNDIMFAGAFTYDFANNVNNNYTTYGNNFPNEGTFTWIFENTGAARSRKVTVTYSRYNTASGSTKYSKSITVDATQNGATLPTYSNLTIKTLKLTYNNGTNTFEYNKTGNFPAELICTYTIDRYYNGTYDSTIEDDQDNFSAYGISTQYMAMTYINPTISLANATTGQITVTTNQTANTTKARTIRCNIIFNSTNITSTNCDLLQGYSPVISYSGIYITSLSYDMANIPCEGGTKVPTNFEYEFDKITNNGISTTKVTYSKTGGKFVIINETAVSQYVQSIDEVTGSITFKPNPTDSIVTIRVIIFINYPDGTQDFAELAEQRSFTFTQDAHRFTYEISDISVNSITYNPDNVPATGGTVTPTTTYTYNKTKKYTCGYSATTVTDNITATKAQDGISLTYKDSNGYISDASANTNTGIIIVGATPNSIVRTVTSLTATAKLNSMTSSKAVTIKQAKREISEIQFSSWVGAVVYGTNNKTDMNAKTLSCSVNVTQYIRKTIYNTGAETSITRKSIQSSDGVSVTNFRFDPNSPKISGAIIDNLTGALSIPANTGTSIRTFTILYDVIGAKPTTSTSSYDYTYDNTFNKTYPPIVVTQEANGFSHYIYTNLTVTKYAYNINGNIPNTGGSYDVSELEFTYMRTPVYMNGNSGTAETRIANKNNNYSVVTDDGLTNAFNILYNSTTNHTIDTNGKLTVGTNNNTNTQSVSVTVNITLNSMTASKTVSYTQDPKPEVKISRPVFIRWV